MSGLVTKTLSKQIGINKKSKDKTLNWSDHNKKRIREEEEEEEEEEEFTSAF